MSFLAKGQGLGWRAWLFFAFGAVVKLSVSNPAVDCKAHFRCGLPTRQIVTWWRAVCVRIVYPLR